MKNIKFNNSIGYESSPIWFFEDYFPSYKFPFEVKNGFLFINEEKIKKIEGTDDQYELEKFDEVFELFRIRSQKINEGEYYKWLLGRQHNNKPHFELVEKCRKDINNYLKYFSKKWNK